MPVSIRNYKCLLTLHSAPNSQVRVKIAKKMYPKINHSNFCNFYNKTLPPSRIWSRTPSVLVQNKLGL